MSPTISIVIPSSGDEVRAKTLARAVARQTFSPKTQYQIVIVAQGWQGEPSLSERTLVVELPGPIGRAQARNVGAREAHEDSEILLFFDADCRLAGTEHIRTLLEAFNDAGVVAAGGPVRAAGNGFWARYQNDADGRRHSAPPAAGPALTTANLAVRRSAYEQCGGFDEAYTGYGFEDRDFLLRLATLGEIVRCDDAVALHDDTLRLQTVVGKMREAGTFSSARFADAHPHAYRALGYAAIDTRIRSWLRPAAVFAHPVLWAASLVEPAFHRRWMPYSVAKALVKTACALAFLYGTTLKHDSSNVA